MSDPVIFVPEGGTTSPLGVEEICCTARAAMLYGAGTPVHLAMLDVEIKDRRKLLDKAAEVDRALIESTNRAAQLSAMLKISVAAHIVTAIVVWFW